MMSRDFLISFQTITQKFFFFNKTDLPKNFLMPLIARASTTCISSIERDELFDINNLSTMNLCVNFATSLFSKYEHNKTIIVGKV